MEKMLKSVFEFNVSLKTFQEYLLNRNKWWW